MAPPTVFEASLTERAIERRKVTMTAALYSLDEPQQVTRVGRIGAWVGVVAYLTLSLLVASRASDPGPELLWIPIAHALVLALVCGLTALLLFGQAGSTGRRGYLMLGSTYLYVTLLLLVFPLFFPGGFGDVGPLLGGVQSAPWLFYAWHFAFVTGLGISVWVFHADRVGHRRPGLPVRIPTVVLATIGAAGLIVLLVAFADQALPTLVPGVGLTSLGAVMDRILLALSVAGTGLALWCQRGGALIQRWLAAAMLLQLGAAIVNLNTARWSFGWYFDRLFGMFSLTSLLVILVYSLSRLGRATNAAATRDALTGAESRASFTQSMDREIAAAGGSGRATALLWVDLDGFKGVNDQFGHTVGDSVLRETVTRIASQIREADHVGRLGGDEFGVLLCDRVEGERVTAVADRVLAALRAPMHVGQHTTIHCTGSLGIATFPTDGDRREELITRADLAMYVAKNSGGDRYLRFSEHLGSEAMERAQLRHDLARAVADKDFDLAFQPIVDLGSGAVVGVEALARWVRGANRVAAHEFIAFAEQSGQIVSIGRLLIEVVERDVHQVLSVLPPGGFLAVNLSARELVDDVLLERLLEGPLTAQAGSIVLEVTETSELQAKPDVTASLDRLRAVGYRLAVDDFGAGFSNFGRLEQLHPDLLKIDRSLVARAGSGVDGGVAFLTAARIVAESLRCDVVAEGVETEAEREIVMALDIRLAQGFLLGEPVRLHELAGVVARSMGAVGAS